MDDQRERERELIDDVRKELPAFVEACVSKTDMVLMHQYAFGAGLDRDELLLLGKAIKYAGLAGKEVRIVPASRVPSQSLTRGVRSANRSLHVHRG
jgi:hypothetical protein